MLVSLYFFCKNVFKKQFASADTPPSPWGYRQQTPAPARSDFTGWVILQGDGEAQKFWCSGAVAYWNQELLILPNFTVHNVSTFSLELSVLWRLGLVWDIYPGTQMALTTIISVFLTLFRAHSTPGPTGNTKNSAFFCPVFNFCSTERGTKWE